MMAYCFTGAGNLMTKDIKEAQILQASFASAFIGKVYLRPPSQ